MRSDRRSRTTPTSVMSPHSGPHVTLEFVQHTPVARRRDARFHARRPLQRFVEDCVDAQFRIPHGQPAPSAPSPKIMIRLLEAELFAPVRNAGPALSPRGRTQASNFSCCRRSARARVQSEPFRFHIAKAICHQLSRRFAQVKHGDASGRFRLGRERRQGTAARSNQT